ncbi:uncharacterized protein RJT20DRAFT_129727 [Scheffersomyces xylosifermentans]|uniref:uncharacterized protein n=1 Tax=Scheffersomyces xylosifermentans TaxID=1304137 RepID=UPI00315D3DC0
MSSMGSEGSLERFLISLTSVDSENKGENTDPNEKAGKEVRSDGKESSKRQRGSITDEAVDLNGGPSSESEDSQIAKKRQKAPIFDSPVSRPIGFVDLQKLEYATKTLQKNVRLLVNEAPDMSGFEKLLNSPEIDQTTKIELISNNYVKVATRLKTKYKVGNLKIFDQIAVGNIEVTEEEKNLLKETEGNEEVQVHLPIQKNPDQESSLPPRDSKIPPLPVIEDQRLFERVFVHKSTVNGKTYLDQHDLINSHNERLEFLGDSVLNNLVTLIIYERFPSASEGELTKIRSQLIDNHTLTQFSFEYGFDKKLRTKTDEIILRSGDQKVYADIFEAYVGALSIERGLDVQEIKEWLIKLYEPKIASFENSLFQESVNKEAKSELYSIVGTASSHPQYEIVKEGNGSNDFVVHCKMGDEILGSARAPSQKEAGLRAAMDALKNRPLLEKYHRMRMEADRKDTIKSKKVKETVDPINEVLKAPSSPIKTSIFPIRAGNDDPIDNNAKNRLYAEIGRRIGEIPQYIVSKNSENVTVVSLILRNLIVSVATDTSKKRAMARAAMAILDNQEALNEICKDSFA